VLAAVATMNPAPDWHYRPPDPQRDVGPLAEAAAYPRGAFLPPALTRPIEQRLLPASGTAAKAPPEPTAAPAALGRRAGWLLLPLVVAPFLLRSRPATLAFFVTYAGTVAFATVFGVAGYARHHGILFLALVGAAWQARREAGPVRPSRAWLAVLGVSSPAWRAAIDQRPFSRAADVAGCCGAKTSPTASSSAGATCPRRRSLGSSRARSTVECECVRRHVVWNTRRVDS
jgi:hypothetical protein